MKRKLYPPRIGPQHASVILGGGDHIRALREAGLDISGAHILEVGTGWFPIMPIMLRIAGAERVYLTDLHRLMDRNTLLASANYVLQNVEQITELLNVSEQRVRKISSIENENNTVESILERLGFTYIAPFDPALQPMKVDAVISHTVFEHIPPSVLRQLILDLKVTLKPGGYMSHGIDNTDHRAIKDKRLSRFDFLRYDDFTWKLLCLDPQDYTNRMRHHDYLRLLEDAGYEAATHKTYVFKDEIKTVSKMSLNPRFRTRAPEDLVIGWSHLIAKMRN